MTSKGRCSILSFLLIAGGCGLGAQENPPTSQSLEDELKALLDMPVTVAGKKAQKISEAPAIISVLTDVDLANMGTTSLYEALSMIPGINLTETNFGFTSVSFRGNLQTHYNNKALVLINNHPTYDTAVGSFYLEQIPIAMIKRIEVLRGPGSTLYGTNAFAGVIKIVTKTPDDTGRGSVALQGGSFGTLGLEATAGATAGGFKFAAGASHLGSTGYEYRVARDENGRAGTLDYRNNVTNGFATMEVDGYVLNLNFWQQRKDKFGLIPTLVSTGRRFHEGFGLDLSKTWSLSEALSLSFSGYGDQIQKTEDVAWYPPAWSAQQAGVGGPERQENKNRKMGADLQLAWMPVDSWRLVGGLYYEKQHTDPYLWKSAITGEFTAFQTSAYLDSHDADDQGGYLQADGRLHEKLGVVAGVRVNRNSIYGTKATPSLGLVFNPTGDVAIKLLYGQAFRNPNFFEKYVATFNVLYGDENLQPEKINSLEVGMDWFVTSSNNLRVNLFSTSSSDLIARVNIPPGPLGNTAVAPQYANADGQKIQGLEIENKGSISRSLSYFLNASFLKGSEKRDDTDIQYIPKILANAGVTAHFGAPWTVATYFQYVGSKEGKLNTGAPNTVGGYSLVHVNLEYRPTPSLRLGLAVRNALDKAWSYPEYIRARVPSTPGGPDRAITAKVAWHF